MNLYPETLPQATATVLQTLKNAAFLKTFYLSGGTALAFQLGHRESEDLDFFSQAAFNPLVIQQALEPYGTLEDIVLEEGTVNLFLQGVQLQFLYYPYALVEPMLTWEGIMLSSLTDIALTKLVTISQRGSKKDFIDLYFILQYITLASLFEKLDQKYGTNHYNAAHILKSLIYFEDAESQPMPRMHKRADWQTVKASITTAVKQFQF